MPPLLVITRPEDRARRFADACRELVEDDLPVLIAPLLRFESVPIACNLSKFSGLIFTSEAAIAALHWPSNLVRPQTWSVGARTARSARAAGFETVDSGGDADALVATILAANPDGPLLHLHGQQTRGAVQARLVAGGLSVESCVIYRQIDVPPDQHAVAALQGRRALVLPVFSPASARRLLAMQPSAPNTVVAISEAAALAWTDSNSDTVVADAPTSNSVAEAVARLYKNG